MTNVYRIGVSLAMASNGAQVLGALARQMTGIHAQAGQLAGGFNKVKLAIGGVVAIGAGLALVGMFKGPLEEAKKFEMAVGRFSRLGLGDARTKEMAEFAKQTKIAGTTYTEMMTRITEAQGVFRQSGLSGEAALQGAKLAAPLLAKINFANAGLDEDSRARASTQSIAMMRFIEMRGGVNSPQRFNQIANEGFKAITSSGGNVNWEQMRQLMAVGGTAVQGLRDDVLFGKLEPLIGELKGGGVGNALMTSYGRLSGAQRLPNQIAHALVDMGIWDGSKIEWNKGGGIKRIKGGVGGLPGNPMRDLAGFSADPLEWYDKNIRSIYEKQNLSAADRARDNFAIFGRQGGKVFNLYERQHEAVIHSADAQRTAMGIDQAYKVAGGTLNGKIIDMHAKFTNLMERLGEAVLPMAVKGLEVLVPALSKLTDWVGKHPSEVRFFAKAAVVVGAGLIALGTAALAIAAGAAIFAAGTVGVVIAGVTATVAVVGSLIALNWSALSKGFRLVYDTVAFMAAHPIKFLSGERPGVDAPMAKTPGMGHWETKLDPYRGVGVRTWVQTPSTVPPPANSNKPVQVHTTVNMDGKKVAKIVSTHQAGGVGSGMAPASASDTGATLPSAAAGYRR